MNSDGSSDASPMQNQHSQKRKRENLICDICRVEVNSELMMEAHIHGQKHLKKMKVKATESVNQTSNSDDVDQKPNPPSTIVKPPVLSSYKGVLQLMNELAKFNKVIIKYDLIKETGPPHAKQFEVRLTVANEIYSGTGTSIKRAQQVAAEQGLLITALQKPEQIVHSSQQINPKFENFLNKKCIEISEDDSTIVKLYDLVENIERAMKIVSDKMMEQCQKNNIQIIPQLPDTNEDPSESFRIIKGVMKVSILAMRLFLKTDHEYTLVLVCANKPTVTLLNDISQELAIVLNTPTSDYQIQADVIDACLIIKSSFLPEHTIRIRLTSPVFFNENSLNLDPIDMLDKDKCLQAAVEIRRSNWFIQHLLNHEHTSSILRLLRYLQYHKTPLSYLNLWCLVSLVHKFENQSMRNLFIYLSSGILLPNKIGFNLFDPCEKDLINITDNLTIEQRLDVTKYAQYILRLIAFEEYDKIFPY